MKKDHPKATEPETTAPRSKWRRAIVRFSQWWAMVFILTGPLAICPFCGQPACGGGAVSAGVLGTIVAALTFVPRRVARIFKTCVQNEEQEDDEDRDSKRQGRYNAGRSQS